MHASLTPSCAHQVQRLTSLLRDEQRKVKRVGSARRTQAEPAVAQTAVHVMLCVVHAPQLPQHGGRAPSEQASQPVTRCSTPTRHPSGQPIELFTPRVLLLYPRILPNHLFWSASSSWHPSCPSACFHSARRASWRWLLHCECPSGPVVVHLAKRHALSRGG